MGGLCPARPGQPASFLAGAPAAPRRPLSYAACLRQAGTALPAAGTGRSHVVQKEDLLLLHPYCPPLLPPAPCLQSHCLLLPSLSAGAAAAAGPAGQPLRARCGSTGGPGSPSGAAGSRECCAAQGAGCLPRRGAGGCGAAGRAGGGGGGDGSACGCAHQGCAARLLLGWPGRQDELSVGGYPLQAGSRAPEVK